MAHVWERLARIRRCGSRASRFRVASHDPTPDMRQGAQSLAIVATLPCTPCPRLGRGLVPFPRHPDGAVTSLVVLAGCADVGGTPRPARFERVFLVALLPCIVGALPPTAVSSHLGKLPTVDPGDLAAAAACSGILLKAAGLLEQAQAG